MLTHDGLIDLAERLKRRLLETQQILVLSESCTCGLVAATLGAIPGISQVFAGSAVTYQNETKAAWLGVNQNHLNDPEITAVSLIVAEEMCRGALTSTPQATLSISITGHLGPDAPLKWDGVIYIGSMFRPKGQPAERESDNLKIRSHRLSGNVPDDPSLSIREYRRLLATRFVLESALNALDSL